MCKNNLNTVNKIIKIDDDKKVFFEENGSFTLINSFYQKQFDGLLLKYNFINGFKL
jgi:hypothetical protein